MAAEIAIAKLTGAEPDFIRDGIRLLRAGKHDPIHLTELASAVGTAELEAGNAKAARRHFRQSLDSPTENSVAQLRWAAKQISDLYFDPKLLQIPRTFEARSWEEYYGGEWEKSLEQTWKWLFDQPFSAQPATLGSYVASVFLEDYSQSIRIAEAGLQANPRNFNLINNFTVGLAKAGRLREAETMFARLVSTSLEPEERIVWLATAGLLSFRGGNAQRGRALYRKAIESAGSESIVLSARAALFLALEELNIRSPSAHEVATSALEQGKALGDLADQALLSLLRIRLEAQTERSTR
jgi:tetratricopeptide (TPR) repeat protein